MGMLFSSSIVRGATLLRMSYSLCPIFAVPEGSTVLCAVSAPRHRSARDSLRLHQPLVHIDHDLTLFAAIRRRNHSAGTVISCGRMKFKL